MKSLRYRNLIVIAFVSIFMNSRSVQFGAYLAVIEVNKCSKYTVCSLYIDSITNYAFMIFRRKKVLGNGIVPYPW